MAAAEELDPSSDRTASARQGGLVSVIVPVYNGERFLGECLESIFAQDYSPFEVIVVDDGSNDRTGEIARSFPEVVYLRQENQGPSVARNTGIAAARGEFISFFDHDDLMMPNKLSTQVGYLLDHREAQCVLGRQEIFCEPGVVLPDWITPDPVYGDMGGVQLMSIVVRREVIDDVGGFDPTYRLAQDVEWTTRLLARGIERPVVSEVVMRRRFHGSNSAYRNPGDLRFLMRAIKTRLEERRAGSTIGNVV